MKYFAMRLPFFVLALGFLSLSHGLSRSQSQSKSPPKPVPQVETKQIPSADKIKNESDLKFTQAPTEIATYNPKTKRVANFKEALLTNKFEDGANITRMGIEKVGDKFFLVRANVGRESCRTSWTALIDNGKGGLGLPMTTVTTESCTGSPCSWCTLVAPGGPCKCMNVDPYRVNRLTGTCTHSISTTSGPRILKGGRYTFH